MKVAVLDDYQNVVKDLKCFDLLKDHEVTVYNDTPDSRDVLVKRLEDKDALVLIRERTIINDALLSQLPNLQLISQTGKKSNHLNMEACTIHGIPVAEGVGSPIAPAELTWTLIMAASRHLVSYVSNFQNGKWQDADGLGLGRKLHGQTLGIWGYGKIGKRIAQFAKAFGMNVVIWGREPSRVSAKEDGFEAAVSKEAFFETCDMITLHLRLNEATQEIVRYEDLVRMKKEARLINTSRAELIEKGALVRALDEGRPGFAALDVYENEPTSTKNEPLLGRANVLCTPHLGYVEQSGYELYFNAAFENVVAFFEGAPQNIANPEVLS